jgi:hypothetical protein
MTLGYKKLAGMGQKHPKLVNGVFQIESAEYEKQKHHYTRQQVLNLKQSKEFKKLEELTGGKRIDQWKQETSGRKSPSAERSQKEKEDGLSTPQKPAAPKDF